MVVSHSEISSHQHQTMVDVSEEATPPPHNALITSTSKASSFCDFYPYKDPKIKTLLKKMIWDIGLSCFLPADNNGDSKSKKGRNLEHNKTWLLAESGGGSGGGAELTSTDPQSVHSSFRFSFCSQVELESMNMSSSSASATVLMVNLDNGLFDSHAQELKWRRIQSLERSISPVANSLIRLSYGEILSATRNFSKG